MSFTILGMLSLQEASNETKWNTWRKSLVFVDSLLFRWRKSDYLVDRVVRPHDPNELYNAIFEIQVLPRPTRIMTIIHNPDPVFLLHGHFNVVGIGPGRTKSNTIGQNRRESPQVAVPQQHANVIDDRGRS
jgi:hypothetical protein